MPLLAILWNSSFKWVYLSFSPLALASLLFSAINYYINISNLFRIFPNIEFFTYHFESFFVISFVLNISCLFVVFM